MTALTNCYFHKDKPASVTCYVCRKSICSDDMKLYVAKSASHRIRYDCCIICYSDQMKKKTFNFSIGFLIAGTIVIPFLGAWVLLNSNENSIVSDSILLVIIILVIPIYLIKMFFKINKEEKLAKKEAKLFENSLKLS